MTSKYISLTEAINLYEEYKIEFFRNVITDGNQISDTADLEIRYNATNIKTQYSLVDHISKGAISLYGKCVIGLDMKKVPKTITSQLISRDLPECFYGISSERYSIYNNYDYETIYNPSTNYDVLFSPIGHDLYTHLSIEYKELEKLVKYIF